MYYVLTSNIVVVHSYQLPSRNFQQQGNVVLFYWEAMSQTSADETAVRIAKTYPDAMSMNVKVFAPGQYPKGSYVRRCFSAGNLCCKNKHCGNLMSLAAAVKKQDTDDDKDIGCCGPCFRLAHSENTTGATSSKKRKVRLVHFLSKCSVHSFCDASKDRLCLYVIYFRGNITGRTRPKSCRPNDDEETAHFNERRKRSNNNRETRRPRRRQCDTRQGHSGQEDGSVHSWLLSQTRYSKHLLLPHLRR